MTDTIADTGTFTCPIFNAPTRHAACAKLMDLVWVGKAPDVRKGCQACMNSSKCPVVNLVFMNRVRDDHNQIRIDGGKLPKELLERIRPIVVMDHHLNQRGVSADERAAIAGANDRIDKMLGNAPSIENQPRRRSAPKPAKAKPAAPAPISNAIADAASTGDLAAAINA